MEEVLVPLAFFAMIAVIVVGPKYLRSRDRERLLDTLRVAYDRGQPVPPELIDTLSRGEERTRVESPDRDLRSAIVLVGVALAFVALGAAIYWAEGDEDAWVVAAIGAFPGFIGLAHFAFWALRRNRADRNPL